MESPGRLDGRREAEVGKIEKEARFTVYDASEASLVFGTGDDILHLLETELGISANARGAEILIRGEEERVDTALTVLEDIRNVVRAGNKVSVRDARHALSLAVGGNGSSLMSVLSDVVQVTNRGKQIKPRTLGQKIYIDAIKESSMTFGIGPAGTGKTYLAVAMAVAAYKAKQVNRIILTRPAVEAGEKLGFLPGDIQEKVDPYLRPLYDALWDIMGIEGFEKLREKGSLEIAPLAYMRGRTLDDAFIILDEAQNTTREQMKMFLTRMGFSSKVVVTGDVTQIDLPKGQVSGLVEAAQVLSSVNGIAVVYLSELDVVRHELVQRIIKAYEVLEENRNGSLFIQAEHDKEQQ